MQGSIASGDYYFVVVVDSRGDVVENDETNNAAAAATAVTVPITLTITSPVTSAREDAAPVRMRVTRSAVAAQPVTATLASPASQHPPLPATLTIPAGFLWAEFDATPVQDSVRAGDQQVTVSASVLDGGGNVLPQYAPGALLFTVLDTAVPDLKLTLSAAEVAEGGT